jgi:quercetin dioxygenase-like cupin family protein
MTSKGHWFTPSILDEIQVPEKGILSHTLYNDEQVKIILFGFAAGEELTAHTAAHARHYTDPERRGDVDPRAGQL